MAQPTGAAGELAEHHLADELRLHPVGADGVFTRRGHGEGVPTLLNGFQAGEQLCSGGLSEAGAFTGLSLIVPRTTTRGRVFTKKANRAPVEHLLLGC